MDEIKKNFLDSLDSIVSDPNMISSAIKGDDKFYLKKTKYNIEIRSDESTTWLAYIRIPMPGDLAYRNHLLNKYLDLVNLSDSKHFESLKED